MENKHLPFTGERLTTELSGHYGITEHLNRYSFAADFVKEKIVLDIACGEGYGANYLANFATQVIGIDIDNKTIDFAKNKYKKSNLTFFASSALEIPLENHTVDVITSFETLEHLIEQNEMIAEFKRVLKPGGKLIISSPEKSIYAERDPNNPFHLKELTFQEFANLLSKYFLNCEFYSQRLIFGSLIMPVSQIPGNTKFDLAKGSYDIIDEGLDTEDSLYLNKPYFNLAVCSDSIEGNLTLNKISFFDGKEFIVSQHKYLMDLRMKLNKLPYKRAIRLFKKIFSIK